MRGSGAAFLAGTLLLAGCAEVPDVGEQAPGGDVPVTARALAVVAAEHVGEPASAASNEWGRVQAYADGRATGVDLRYGTEGEDDGALVSVTVGTGFERDVASCRATGWEPSGCEDFGGKGLLLWEEAAPEEDPGGVTVVMPKDEATVVVSYSGPEITEDPRRMDLPVEVGTLLDLATDPRVDVTTSQAAVDAGGTIDFWLD
jgi:hypothetical protein